LSKSIALKAEAPRGTFQDRRSACFINNRVFKDTAFRGKPITASLHSKAAIS
jgi:hypothetical protein